MPPLTFAPVLLAVSDNGPQMTSGSTREFMAMCAIAQHFGRPGTPTDQAWIESLFSHIKADYVDESALGLGKALEAARRDTVHAGHKLIPECPLGVLDPDELRRANGAAAEATAA